MKLIIARGALACALLASVSAPTSAADGTGSMYLRAPNLRSAPVVLRLSYDAVATVPARPNTPAALLPVDQVQGSIIIPDQTTAPALSRKSFANVSTFTVVQINAKGVVVQRTVFDGVAVMSVDPVGTGDGSMGRRVRFDAAMVHVVPAHAT
jgi:hypothetical protein